MLPDLGGKLVELLHQVVPSRAASHTWGTPPMPKSCRCGQTPLMPPDGSGLMWWWLMSSRRKTSNRLSPASSSRSPKRCWLGSIP